MGGDRMIGLAWALEGVRKYGEYKSKYYDAGIPSEPDYMTALIVVWVVFFVVLLLLLHHYWNEIEAVWNAIFNRNAVRSVTVIIRGTEVDRLKMKDLTKDVNGLLNGKIMDIVKEKHRVNAKNIVGMSITPGAGCLMFTTWYKR
jgi:uncharacterized protein involved in cysteine biosynthesis